MWGSRGTVWGGNVDIGTNRIENIVLPITILRHISNTVIILTRINLELSGVFTIQLSSTDSVFNVDMRYESVEACGVREESFEACGVRYESFEACGVRYESFEACGIRYESFKACGVR